jgi:hypothetical protein
LEKELQRKVTELVKPHDAGHPITYNHYLTDNVQKMQADRRMRGIKKTLEQFFGDDYTNLGTVKLSINVESLTKLIAKKTEADMDNYASSTATDFMEAYYKVQSSSFSTDRVHLTHTNRSYLRSSSMISVCLQSRHVSLRASQHYFAQRTYWISTME